MTEDIIKMYARVNSGNKLETHEIVYGLRDLHVIQKISPPLAQNLSFDELQPLVERAKLAAVWQLKDALDPYIAILVVTDNPSEPYVKADLWLPYIRDDYVKTLERDLKREKSWSGLYLNNIQLWNDLPWVKKLWAVLRNRAKLSEFYRHKEATTGE